MLTKGERGSRIQAFNPSQTSSTRLFFGSIFNTDVANDVKLPCRRRTQNVHVAHHFCDEQLCFLTEEFVSGLFR